MPRTEKKARTTSQRPYRQLFQALSVPVSACDGTSRAQPATGLLVRGIRVNGHYLLTENCTVYMRQDVAERAYIQGGPRMAIADIGMKHVEGQINAPVRVRADGTLEPAVVDLLRAAENPGAALRVDTNHAYSYPGMTADGGGTSGNALLSFDCLLVSSLRLSMTPQNGVTLEATVTGSIDGRDSSLLVTEPTDFALGRKLGFADCNASRYESAMRTTSRMEVSIENAVTLSPFLLPATAAVNDRTEQPSALTVTACKWSGKIEEITRVGLDRETLMHGGWMQNENLCMTFGPLSATFTVPLTEPAEQPLSASILLRTTSVRALVSPTLRQGGLFTFPEGT